MAPKAKKPSKAELAAEAERLAEEQRIADEIEAKRQEELRIEREAHEAVEAEQRRAAEEEHIARVAAELEIHGPSYASEAAELRKERAAFEADKLWNRYITDTVLPDPTDQPGVRSYLYAWETSPTSSDLEKAFDELQEAATLRTNLVTESMLAQEQGDLARATWQRELVAELDELVQSKLDAATAAFLVSTESLPEAKAGDVSRQGFREGTFSAGLWVNLTKNPRTKVVDFSQIGISTEIPKTLALGSVAIRAFQSYVDHVTPVNELVLEELEASDQNEHENAGANPEDTEAEANRTAAEAKVAESLPHKAELAASESLPSAEGGEGLEAQAEAKEAGGEGVAPADAESTQVGAAESTDAIAEVDETAADASADTEEADEESAPDESPRFKWMTLGGVVTVDVLTLPPSGIRAKGWSMRELTKLENGVERQIYPVAEQALTAAPLKISFKLPGHVEAPPHGAIGKGAKGGGGEYAVAFFDEEARSWITDGVVDAEYDAASHSISAYSPRLTATLALVAPRHREFPFARWLIVPQNHNQCSLFLKTATRSIEMVVSAAGVAIAAKEGGADASGGEDGCVVNVLDSLSGGKPCPPSVLFSRLREAGIHLCPSNADAATLNRSEAIVTRHIIPKEDAFEAELHAEITKLVAAGLQITSSKHSQRMGSTSALLRLAPLPPEEEPLDEDAPPVKVEPWSLVNDQWQCMVVTKTGPAGNPVDRYAALIKGTESAGFEAFDLSVIQGSTSHTTPILCVQAEGEAKYPGLPLLRSASRLYQDTLRQVLDKFRPFSFTKM